MNEFSFDTQGHLFPYDLIETDWVSFADAFGWSDHPRQLIESLDLLLLEVRKLPVSTFVIWIDGSFVTKKERPNDLDIVLVIPAVLHQQFEKDLAILRDQFIGLDVYFVRMIADDAPNHFLYISDRAEWWFQFTTTRPNKITRRKFAKGFIQITCNDGPSLRTP